MPCLFCPFFWFRKENCKQTGLHFTQQIFAWAYLTISASEYSGSVFSKQHANTSSQWNVPLCVPIFIVVRARLACNSSLICLEKNFQFLQTEKEASINTDTLEGYTPDPNWPNELVLKCMAIRPLNSGRMPIWVRCGRPWGSTTLASGEHKTKLNISHKG